MLSPSRQLYCLTLVTLVGIGGGGCGHSYAPAIDSVMNQAEKANTEIMAEHSTATTSKTLRRIVAAFEAIDLRDCHSDFQKAYLDYVTEIELFIPFSERYDDISVYSIYWNTTEFFTMGPGRLAEVIDEANERKKRLFAARQTIKEIAIKYGCKGDQKF